MIGGGGRVGETPFGYGYDLAALLLAAASETVSYGGDVDLPILVDDFIPPQSCLSWLHL